MTLLQGCWVGLQAAKLLEASGSCASNKKAAWSLLREAAVRQRSFSVQAPLVLLTSC